MDFTHILQTILISALPVVLAITLQEAARGYAAQRLGDPTPRQCGRLSWNPANHLDWKGTVLIPLVLFVLTNGSFLFGYAKPVPIDARYFQNPKRDLITLALAGPGLNLIQGLYWGVLALVFAFVNLQGDFFMGMCQAGLLINAALFAFNMFPIPPLPGGRVLIGLLPPVQGYQLSRLEPWGFWIVMGLAIVGVLGSLWMRPIMSLVLSVWTLLLTPVQMLLK